MECGLIKHKIGIGFCCDVCIFCLVYERALDVDYRNQSLWLKYADMEMRGKFINHARNVWDRAVTLLPRIDQFW